MPEHLVERKIYLNKLKQARGKRLIKVITGVRRCGKSTLLRQYRDILLSQGIAPSQILTIEFDRIEAEPLLEYHALYRYITERLTTKELTYLFLDEVQLVPNFQKAIVTLFEQSPVDIYLTGSNATMLSGELATLLSGRYIEIALFPLSLTEYCELRKQPAAVAWRDYFNWGGFPYISKLPDEDIRLDYLSGIYHTVLVKDIIQRRNIQDVTRLENVTKFMLANIGNIVSAKKIADTLTSQGHKTASATIDQYLHTLGEAFILYPCPRYDVQGKQYLKTLQKYYIVDLGFRRLILGHPGTDIGHLLENIVYLELRRRGGRVSIGKIGEREIDFLHEYGGERAYYQVAATVLDSTTFKREITPLKQIKDNYPKYILTLDTLPLAEDGIKQINLVEWLTLSPRDTEG
ncbi:MAG: ATP-binding protein [Selenomonadaceae bacterium]|nr:ATP-binding protein [Selenomonadaceae bacterium]